MISFEWVRVYSIFETIERVFFFPTTPTPHPPIHEPFWVGRDCFFCVLPVDNQKISSSITFLDEEAEAFRSRTRLARGWMNAELVTSAPRYYGSDLISIDELVIPPVLSRLFLFFCLDILLVQQGFSCMTFVHLSSTSVVLRVTEINNVNIVLLTWSYVASCVTELSDSKIFTYMYYVWPQFLFEESRRRSTFVSRSPGKIGLCQRVLIKGRKTVKVESRLCRRFIIPLFTVTSIDRWVLNLTSFMGH